MIEQKFDVVIACGGFGTRLIDITKNTPKPLYPIAGKSTIQRILEELNQFGLENILITTSYRSEYFVDHVSKLRRHFKQNIEIFIEENPLGECGSLWILREKLADTFVFINGDLIFSIDFERFFSYHKRLNSKFTIVTHTSDHPYDSDLVSCPNGSLIEDIFLKSSFRNNMQHAYLGNSGISIINKEIINLINPPKEANRSSVFNHLVKKLFDKKIRIFSYNTTEYIKDMGTPDRFLKVERDLKDKIVSKKNYNFKQKVLFLDRDNTLISCKKGEYIITLKGVKFIDENITKIGLISNDFDFVCLVTNQPQIAMGLINYSELDQINSFIINYCISKGLKIDVVTFCPHHPEKGHPNELGILKKDCFCRKPNPGLLIEQSFLRNIDLNSSLMIGDSENDYYAALNAGCNFKFIKNI